MSPCFLLVIVLLTSVCCPCLSSGILGMTLSSRPHSSTYVKQSSILLLLCRRRHHHHPSLRFLSHQSCLTPHANSSTNSLLASSQAMLQGPVSFWRLFVALSADALMVPLRKVDVQTETVLSRGGKLGEMHLARKKASVCGSIRS